MASNSKQLHKNLNQTQWLVQITQLLQPNNLQSALQTPTSIFKTPPSISNKTPNSYSPTHIALGPYNHFKNKLNQIQLYKLENAINTREAYQLPRLDQIVDELEQSDIRIRSCYDMFLDIGSEDLAWIMLLDGLFFIQLLVISNDTKEKNRGLGSVLEFPLFHEQKLYSYLTEENKNSITQDEFFKDILKLENQIPIFVLKNILPEKFERNLDLLFFKFCDSASPLQLPPHDIPEFMKYRGYTNLSKIFDESHHLLHFLYLLILDRSSSIDSAVGMALFGGSFFVELFNVLSSVLQIGLFHQLSEALGLIQRLFGLIRRVESSSSSTGDDDNCPSLIPSAYELGRVGVEFEVKYEDFHESIRFKQEPRKVCLELPAMTINDFSEVVLRNLVAFEASTKIKPPSFSNYIAVMSGLVSRGKDVKILKEAKIIESHSRSEEEVVKLFDGLRKDLKFLHMNMGEIQMVNDINEYYESCWKVKLKRFIQKYVNPILKGIFVFVVFLLVLVVIVKTFCAWFGCSKLFPLLSGGMIKS